MITGSLRHRLALQSQTDGTPDTGGDWVGSAWTTVATVFAAIEPVNSAEAFAQGKVSADVTHKITIRNRTDVRPTWRGTYDSRVFEFVSVTRREERALALEIMARELIS